MRWPWKKSASNSLDQSSQTLSGNDSRILEPNWNELRFGTAIDELPRSPENTRNFSFYWFFLVFWLTVIATVLMSWNMIVPS